MNKKQRKKIEEIIHEKMKLMQHHFSRLMVQMVNEINKLVEINKSKKGEKK